MAAEERGLVKNKCDWCSSTFEDLHRKCDCHEVSFCHDDSCCEHWHGRSQIATDRRLHVQALLHEQKVQLGMERLIRAIVALIIIIGVLWEKARTNRNPE